MSRAIVTPELAETLRNIRLQNKISAKSLAEHIEKSQAFISKLEKGNIQTIDTTELYKILQFISKEENNFDLGEQIYKSLKIKYSKKEIEEQLWFVNYDTVECLLPVPQTLLDEINEIISELEISRQYLNNRINANEALSREDIENNTIPYNEWYHQNRIEGNAQSIKIKLPLEKMNNILDSKTDVSPYVFVFCIVYYILKIKLYGEIKEISDEQNTELMQKATETLNKHKFLSISEKNAIIHKNQSAEEIQELLSSFDNSNIEIVNDIINGFRFASDHNIKQTNEHLKTFSDNMHWDLGFMLRLIGMNFHDLNKTSVSNKKNLLNELEELLQKYIDLPDEKNVIEEY